MKAKVLLSMAAMMVASSVMLQAETELNLPSGVELSSTATFTSNYIFRGQSKTATRPAVGLTLDAEHESGVYAGLDGYNIDSESASLQANYSVGFASELTDTIKYDVAVVYRDTLGSGTENTLFNGEAEVEAEVEYATESFGDVSALVSYGTDSEELYYEVGLATTFGANVSYGSIENVGAFVGADYDVFAISDYSLSVELAYLMPEDDSADEELEYALTLKKAF
tara:strand:- start:1078 stop:1752 length:675 start_codon:yes stop_codon:yes gene_type:complete